MADTPVVIIGENSPEHVAYRLMKDIASIENGDRKDRKWWLDTHAECLATVKNPLGRLAERDGE